jgi:hypothetical protein
MAHAHCMLDTSGYRYTLSMCNTYCCSTPPMVEKTRLSGALYVHYLSHYGLTSFPDPLCNALIVLGEILATEQQ